MNDKNNFTDVKTRFLNLILDNGVSLLSKMHTNNLKEI